jgi:predicted TIM-barrel fold metal-dependent hydrolase
MDLSEIPLLDHHCHALRRPAASLDAATFRSHFSESSDPGMLPHLAFSLFYQRGLMDLATVLGCEPTEEAFLAARNQPPLPLYAQKLFQAAHISALLVDTGLRSGENYPLDEMRAFLPCPILEVLRLETVIEQLLLETDRFPALEEAFRTRLTEARSQGIVALKSIAAYRGGLQIEPRGRFDLLRAQALREGQIRLSDRPFLEYLLRVALETAALQELPVQFHTGFGDDDADLRSANPLHLRPLLKDPALKQVRFVLLHTYPYIREAGYLASLYGNVYADLSLTIPFTAHGGEEAILAALELAPTSKLLLSTDAYRLPELFYLGARYARENLAQALERLQARGWLDKARSEHVARQLLYENAQAVYGIEGGAGS